MSKPQDIDNFNGYFAFLNNDFPTWVWYEGALYPSVTVAFQAARTDDPAIRTKILNVQDFEELGAIATSIKNPANWHTRRYKVMERLIRDKFKRNKQIREKLMATADRALINTFKKGGENELYWGVVNGAGSNFLGKILEFIRQQIKRGLDLERWLQAIGIEKEIELLPYLVIKVEKQGEALTKLELNKKSYYTFGSVPTSNDFHLQHPSISRQHACIYFSTSIEAFLVDLNSTAGTSVNNKPIPPLQPVKLSVGDQISFGKSSRKYLVVKLDTKQAMAYADKKMEQVKRELKEIETLKDGGVSSQQIRSSLGFKVQDYLIVENLPQNTSIRKLQHLFGEYAKVREVNVLIDLKTGKEVGTAIVRFKDPKELTDQIILKRRRFELSGRNLTLRVADSIEANSVREKYNTLKQEPNVKREQKRRSRSRDKGKARDY